MNYYYTAGMDKEEIKTKLLEAVKKDSHAGDIKSVALFGSYVNGTPGESSDIDVLIVFEPTAVIGLFEFVGIKQNLSSVLGREVDLVTRAALSKYFRDQVIQEAELVYER